MYVVVRLVSRDGNQVCFLTPTPVLILLPSAPPSRASGCRTYSLPDSACWAPGRQRISFLHCTLESLLHHICFSETPTHGPEQGSHREAAHSLQAPLLSDLQSALVPTGAAQSPAPAAALPMTRSRTLSPAGTETRVARIFWKSYSNEKCERAGPCFAAALWASWLVSHYAATPRGCAASPSSTRVAGRKRAVCYLQHESWTCVSPPTSRCSVSTLIRAHSYGYSGTGNKRKTFDF